MKPDGANSGERAHNLARDFALRAADHDRHATFPFENFDALKAAGMLGASLSTLPRFQEAVGEIDARLLTNRVLIEAAATRTDNGAAPPATESGLIKMTATTNAIAAVERAVELIGNPGLSRANQLERHLRDVLCSRIHTPQNDSILVAAGRAAFKAQEQRGERP
jgi:alkylation response protein AidB-like acyl-CoA dehydrogenase